ncbi:hypothetical protein TrLO_g5306 [Triparma laevis f. longispina]|uniref:MYND-type domain-containing protein n=1 Tax=Triparma laevis f. longispina TaxID=1714387 RepID=A0A9W7FCN6_9STRA|nr:hypothetical protein TrLO_g5306 [Triparma laevis f. longispina]
MSDARNSSNNTRHASRSSGATHMSSQQKGAGAGNKAGTSEEEQADAFMQEIAKRERLAAQVEQKKLEGAGDTGTGKKKKGKSSKNKKIVLKASAEGATSVKPDGTTASKLAVTSVNKCNVCGNAATSKCKCLIIHYCSRNCQVADWKVHKKMCIANPKNLARINALKEGKGVCETAGKVVPSLEELEKLGEEVSKITVKEE